MFFGGESPSLDESDCRRLDERFAAMGRALDRYIGYPVNAAFDYSPLLRFLQYPINNVGDPFIASNIRINTHDFEREVVKIFGELTHANPESTWGYVTNGGTEGNMYGIFLARELYPDGLVYYSEDTHYSVNKILRCLHVRNIMIKSRPDGRIDLEDLRETIKIHRDVPPIVFANIGTTMKGAVDDIAGIQAIFRDLAIHEAYIHADAALSGMILPFVDRPPPWDFQAGVDSISISGHKMIGSPIPCGVALAQGKCRAHRPARRICRHARHHDFRLAQRHHAALPLVCVSHRGDRRLPQVGARLAGHGRLRDGEIEGRRQEALAKRKFSDRGIRAAVDEPNSQVAIGGAQ